MTGIHALILIVALALVRAMESQAAAESPPAKNSLIALTLRDSAGRLQIFTIHPDGTGKQQLTFDLFIRTLEQRIIRLEELPCSRVWEGVLIEFVVVVVESIDVVSKRFRAQHERPRCISAFRPLQQQSSHK